MPFTGSTGPVEHLHGLTDLSKAICGVAIYIRMFGVPGQYQSVAIMLSYRYSYVAINWIFNCYANRGSFHRTSYI